MKHLYKTNLKYHVIFSTKYRRKCLNYIHDDVIDAFKYVQVKLDFKIDNQYVEIKGDQFFKDNGTIQNPYDHSLNALYEAKHQCMIQNNVIILKGNDYKKYEDYVQNKYGLFKTI